MIRKCSSLRQQLSSFRVCHICTTCVCTHRWAHTHTCTNLCACMCSLSCVSAHWCRLLSLNLCSLSTVPLSLSNDTWVPLELVHCVIHMYVLSLLVLCMHLVNGYGCRLCTHTYTSKQHFHWNQYYSEVSAYFGLRLVWDLLYSVKYNFQWFRFHGNRQIFERWIVFNWP